MSKSNKNNSLEEKLRRLIETIDIANALTEPMTSSIKDLLGLAAKSMKSEEASVLVSDGGNGDLKFMIAIGKVADQLIGMRVPSGKGIAGFVYSSGQPMAVADVGQENSFYAEVDKTTGYSTQTILATPLRYKDQMMGVLEFVNREGEPPYEAFTPFEMDKAALFAEAIAPMIYAYKAARGSQELATRLLQSETKAEIEELRDWLRSIRSSDEHKEMIDLAILVRQIGDLGQAQRDMCREVLEAILRNSVDKNETGFLSY